VLEDLRAPMHTPTTLDMGGLLNASCFYVSKHTNNFGEVNA